MADAGAPYRIKGETGDWEVVVGLEVHVQLKTRTKAFCNCSAGLLSPRLDLGTFSRPMIISAFRRWALWASTRTKIECLSPSPRSP